MTPTGNCYLSKVIPGHVTGHVTRPVIITQPYSVYYCVYCEGTEQQKCCSSLLQENIVRRTQKLTWGRDYKKQKLLLLLLTLAGSLVNSITTVIGVGPVKNFFLLSQLCIVNYYIKSFSNNLRNENMKTYSSKIVHFGILIHVLSWRQHKHQCILCMFPLLRVFDELLTE